MFLSEWREFPSAPCLAEKKLDNSCLDVVEIARVPDMLPSFFLPGRAKDLSAPLYKIPTFKPIRNSTVYIFTSTYHKRLCSPV